MSKEVIDSNPEVTLDSLIEAISYHNKAKSMLNDPIYIQKSVREEVLETHHILQHRLNSYIDKRIDKRLEKLGIISLGEK